MNKEEKIIDTSKNRDDYWFKSWSYANRKAILLQQRIDKAIDDIDKLEKDIINNTIIGFNQFVPVFNKIKNNLKGSDPNDI